MLLAKKPELLKKEHEKQVNEIWYEILDFYYRSTNKAEWIKFLSNLKKVEKIKNEITGCKAALGLVELFDERGYEHLKSFGINSTDTDRIKSAILNKETALEFAENRLIKNDKEESFRFYKVLASVQYSLKRNIDVENTCLAEWVEIMNDLSERNKAEVEAYNKTKLKSRR
jgi:hypothetical protein